MSITNWRKLMIASVGTIALVIAVSVAVVAPGRATFPGQNGLIAFDRIVKGVPQILRHQRHWY